MIIDAHVRLGAGREVELTVDDLLSTMDSLGIDKAMISPAERFVAFDNTIGNQAIALTARSHPDRLMPYAVANPWRGEDAVTELRNCADNGAVALAVDPILQGFDLLDGLLDPLLAFAGDAGWPVYVRTGTPPSALPLPLATLARRWPHISFLMGRSGATDFWIDAVPALLHAPNLYADTSYAPWDTVLTGFAQADGVGVERVIFSTDAPYTVPSTELARIRDWATITDPQRAQVLGGTLQTLLPRS